MTGSFADKVAIVTGAANGIGRASAQAFAERGAAVVVADVDRSGGDVTAKLITDAGGQASFIECDVSDEQAVAALVAYALGAYGRLDFAHNNAGISPGTGDTTACESSMWDRVIGVNLTGVWLGMKYQIPAMLETGGGAIVNTSSVAGLVAFAGAPAYVASKWGVIGVTKAAAREFAAQGIRVNAICPGSAHTAMLQDVIDQGYATLDDFAAMSPMNRVAPPEEIAAAAVWLCSADASFVTGAALPVEGGMTIGP